VQVKLWDPLRTRAIPERLRGAFTTRRYTNPRLPLPLPLPVDWSALSRISPRGLACTYSWMWPTGLQFGMLQSIHSVLNVSLYIWLIVKSNNKHIMLRLHSNTNSMVARSPVNTIDSCWNHGCSLVKYNQTHLNSIRRIVPSDITCGLFRRQLKGHLVIRVTVVCRSTCTQHVWWPVLCHCRAAGLELFTGWTATM